MKVKNLFENYSPKYGELYNKLQITKNKIYKLTSMLKNTSEFDSRKKISNELFHLKQERLNIEKEIKEQQQRQKRNQPGYVKED